jgi:hypothetical protein
MKKKQTKKLVLSRETLRDLEQGKLGRVVGASDGSGGPMCGASLCLNCINTQFCQTQNTCGSRAC